MAVVAPDDRQLVKIERLVSITIGSAAAVGILWTFNQLSTPLNAVAFFAAIELCIPLLTATAIHGPVWMTRWVNGRNNGNPKFELFDIQGYLRRFPQGSFVPGLVVEEGSHHAPATIDQTAVYAPKYGRHLSMEVDPRELVHCEKILAQTRQICAATAACAVISVAVLLTGWLILQQPWIFASACAFAVLLAWEIYPRNGIRYRTGLLMRDSLVRSLCLGALREALQGQTPLEEWRPEYFDMLRAPPDRSIEEYLAASWIHTYALLSGDMETATRYIERQLVLLPENAPATQYVGLGDAVYFYTVGAPDAGKSKLLAQRIQTLSWDLPIRVEYIEAAIALAEGRPADARSIASAQLDRIGPEGGTAWIQLNRELLIRCRDSALSD